MSWQPNWCEAAEHVARLRGWHLREHADGSLNLANTDHCTALIDLTEANKYFDMGANATADREALRAIETAAEQLGKLEQALADAREATIAKFKPRSFKQRLLDRIA